MWFCQMNDIIHIVYVKWVIPFTLIIWIMSYLFSKVGFQLQRAPSFPQASRSINPFDVNSEAALVQAPMVGQFKFIPRRYNFLGSFLFIWIDYFLFSHFFYLSLFCFSSYDCINYMFYTCEGILCIFFTSLLIQFSETLESYSIACAENNQMVMWIRKWNWQESRIFALVIQCRNRVVLITSSTVAALTYRVFAWWFNVEISLYF